MSIGVIGRKCGMTRVFAEDGASIPVTVIQVESNRITQVKGDAEGYRSVQVTTGVRRATRVTKAMAGHYAKAGTGAGRISGEFRLGKDEGAELKAGGEIKATHGNSLSHRAPGSIGQRQTPGRVFPGKKMSGHLGAKRRTAINLQVVQVDAEKNLLLVKGAVPGSEGGNVIVRPSARG
jgi:large subunit ribosomal protein L3